MLTNSDQPFESAHSTSTQTFFKQLTSWISNATGAMLNLLWVEPNTEPRIIQIEGQTGELFWEVYEPITGQTFYCMTEEEVMKWLDGDRWM